MILPLEITKNVALLAIWVSLAIILYSIITASALINPITVDSQNYYMQPGDTLTQDMRICVIRGGNLVITNVMFTGNHSEWAKVNEEFPITAAEAANGATSTSLPVTLAVPSNYTGGDTTIQAIIEIENPPYLSGAGGTLKIIFGENFDAVQSLRECKSLRDYETSRIYGNIISITIGAAMFAIGYFVHRCSKVKSKERRASLGAKVLFILLVFAGIFLMLGTFFQPI